MSKQISKLCAGALSSLVGFVAGLALIASLTTLAPGTAQAATASASRVVTVMPIGDSLMAGVGDDRGGLRREFRSSLKAQGLTVDYLGDVPSGAPGEDLDSMAWGGRCIGAPANSGINCGFADQEKGIYGLIQGRMAALRPEVIIMMAGVNDRFCNTPAVCGDLVVSYRRFLDLAYTEVPNVVFLLSTGRDFVNTNGDFYTEQRPRLEGLAAEQRKAGRKVFFVPAYDGIDAVDAADGLHLTPTGYDKMGRNYAKVFLDQARSSLSATATPASAAAPAALTPQPATESFESSDGGWTAQDDASKVVVSTGQSRSGKSALEATGTEPAAQITVERPAGKYRLRLYVSADSAAEVQLSLNTWKAGWTGGKFDSPIWRAPLRQADWTELSTEFVSEGGPVQFIVIGHGTNKIRIDDVSVASTTSTAKTPTTTKKKTTTKRPTTTKKAKRA